MKIGGFGFGGSGSTGDGSPGPKGDTGTIAVWKGAWNSLTAYVTNDAVKLNGSSYIALQSNTNVDPESDTDELYWRLQAQKGDPGQDGEDGDTGVRGSIWFIGSGTPDNLMGVNNDLYLNTDNGDVYQKSSGIWGSPVTNITGGPGEDGDDGDNGAPGSKWYVDTTAPDDGTGIDGDLYLNTTTGDVYQKAAGTWGSPAGNILGQPGEDGSDGADGATWYTSSGAPSGGTGVDNDLDLDVDTGNIYEKISSSWTLVGNIRGPAGEDGEDAEDGEDGTNGATWFTGSGTPSGGTGVNNDLYLDTDTDDVFKKIAGTWSLIANIKGEPGDDGTDGATILTGSGAPDDADGNDGDLYFDTDSDDLYQKLSGTWGSPIANLAGSPGDDGDDGIDAVGLTSTTVKTANYTASNGELVIANPAAGGFTVDLPHSPLNGYRVAVYCANHLADDSATRMVVVNNTSNSIHGYEDSPYYQLWVKHEFVVLSYDSDLNRWEIIAERRFQVPQNVQGPSGDYVALSGDIVIDNGSTSADQTITLPINQFRASDRVIVKCGTNRPAHPVIVSSQGNHIISRDGDNASLNLKWAGESIELLHGSSSFWQVIADCRLSFPHISVGAEETDSSTWSQVYVELSGTLATSITRAIHSRLTIVEGDGTNAGTAIFGDAIVDTSDDVQHIVGVQGYARHKGTGNVNQLIALNAKCINDGNGTIDNLYTIFIYGPTSATGVTNAYGIYINDFDSYGSGDSFAIWSGNGPIHFGAWCEVVGAIYGASKLNIEGSIGIGLSRGNPSVSLEVLSPTGTSAIFKSDASAGIVSVRDTDDNEMLFGASGTYGHFLLGSGSHPLRFGTDETDRWQIDATGHFIAATDNSYDLGGSSNRPRDLYAARNVNFSGLPTSDPHVNGLLWRSGNDVKVSTG